MLDLANPAAVVAEAQRRQQLRNQGASTFALAVDTQAQRIVDEAEIGRLEKEIEHACDRTHPGRTKQTPGIADRLYGFPWLRLAVWWECKTPAGKQRPDQKLFEEDVTRCGHEYALGGLGDFKAWLIARGVVDGFDAEGQPITRVMA